MVRREPDEGAMERDRVVRIAHDRNGDKADFANAAACGIEPANKFAPRHGSTRELSSSRAPSDRRAGRQGTRTQTAPRNRVSAPPRSTAWRNRGNYHGRAGASPPAAGFPSLPAAGSGSRD